MIASSLIWVAPKAVTSFDYRPDAFAVKAKPVYTTLGFGDLVPLGPIRHMTGSESVAGLVLITWSASFTFLEMQRFWKD